ncbi:MAG: TorF family putative porin [Thiolinea sp.]
MNSLLKKSSLALLILSGSTFYSHAIAGNASANIGILSSYVSRGISLSDDKLSLSPGLHYQADNGFYTGFRSYTTGGAEPFFEIDGYAGYTKTLDNGFTYDVSLLTYQFPDQKNFGTDHFEELSLKGRYGMFEVSYARFLNSITEGDQYYSASVTKPLDNGVTLKALVGHNDYSSENDPMGLFDYTNYELSASWKDFTLTAHYNDNDLFEVDPKVTLGWRKYFGF